MRTMVLLAAATLVGGTVEAQATAQGRARTAEVEARRAETEATVRHRVLQRAMVHDSALLNRASIGVTLGGSANKRDTLGVFVEAVAENGPAERAGIFEGHRIAYVNNVDVRSSAADAGDPYLSSVGRHRLMKAMRDVQAGSTVTLRVWTGSGYRDVQVTAARYADVYRNQRIGSFSYTPGAEFTAVESYRVVPPVRLRATPAPSEPRIMSTPRIIRTPRGLAPSAVGVRRYTI